MNYYTIEEVEKHNKPDDLWIIISYKMNDKMVDNIYDITEFANIHPGGKQLLYSVGGQDATEYFYELHREEILHEIGDEYIIGTLVSSKL
jgi:cytochrome b involved in lipid metabolism